MLTKLKIDGNGKMQDLKKPEIIKVTGFNKEDLTYFEKKFDEIHDSGQRILPLSIDTSGGDVYTLMSMISKIQSSPLDVVTVCEGFALSSGAVLFSMGDKRIASPNATFMIHDISWTLNGSTTNLKNKQSWLDQLNNHLFNMLSTNCSHTEDYFRDLLKLHSGEDWYMNSEEALKHGLATHVGYPTLTCQVEYKWDLSIST